MSAAVIAKNAVGLVGEAVQVFKAAPVLTGVGAGTIAIGAGAGIWGAGKGVKEAADGIGDGVLKAGIGLAAAYLVYKAITSSRQATK